MYGNMRGYHDRTGDMHGHVWRGDEVVVIKFETGTVASIPAGLIRLEYRQL